MSREEYRAGPAAVRPARQCPSYSAIVSGLALDNEGASAQHGIQSLPSTQGGTTWADDSGLLD